MKPSISRPAAWHFTLTCSDPGGVMFALSEAKRWVRSALTENAYMPASFAEPALKGAGRCLSSSAI